MAQEIANFEHLTAKVPYEILNKRFRLAQKAIDREVSTLQNVTGEVIETFTKLPPDESPKCSEVSALLDRVTLALDRMTSRLSSAVSGECESAKELKGRLEHLLSALTPDRGTNGNGEKLNEHWKKTRIDRMVVEYLLRSGYLETAGMMVEQLGIEKLTNLPLFHSAVEVEAALQRKQLGPCLKWCADNKSKLRRLGSMFEMQVRRQEFVELIKTGNYLDATKYAQKHFSTLDHASWKQLLPYMGLLAHPPSTSLMTYKLLYAEERWKDLIEDFHAENLKVFQLNVQSVFSSCLQVGLSAMKTPHCYSSPEVHPRSSDESRRYSQRAPLASAESGQSDPETMDTGDHGSVLDCSDGRSAPVVRLTRLGATGDSTSNLVAAALARRSECPICIPSVGSLATEVPFAHTSQLRNLQSRLVCWLSGEHMNEHNPPLALPNGMVYAQSTILSLAASHPDGLVVCPRTKDVFTLKDADRVFVM